MIKPFFVTVLTEYWEIEDPNPWSAVVLSIQVFGILGFQIRGRAWVRVILILLFIISVAGYTLLGLEDLKVHILIGLASFAQVVLQIAVLAILFSKPVKTWFS